MTTLAPPEAPAVEPGPQPPSPASQARPAKPAPSWLLPITVVLAIIGALGAWLALYIGPLSGLQEARSQSLGYGLLREQLASGVTPPPPFAPNSTLKAGDPLAIMNIPAIGMKRAVVFEGSTSGTLEKGPGHLPGTVLPGETGISALLGRSAGFGGPYGKIDRLHAGDQISMTTGQGSYTYTVVDVRGPGQAIPGSLASATGRLVLVTSENNGWRNLWVPTHAIYVDAVIKGKAGAVAASSPTLPADLPMHRENSGLFVLVLWVQLLLIVSLGLAWSAAKWGRWQLWAVGAPALVAVLWGASSQFVQVLPNLL